MGKESRRRNRQVARVFIAWVERQRRVGLYGENCGGRILWLDADRAPADRKPVPVRYKRPLTSPTIFGGSQWPRNMLNGRGSK